MTDPSEVPEEALVDGMKVSVLLRDPSSYFVDDSGEPTMLLVPPPFTLQWHAVPFVEEPDDCKHGSTVCVECLYEWNIDHYVRIKDDEGSIVYQSEDFPVGPDNS